MIKFFGSGRPDHPMADPKEAKRLLSELPAQDPYKALEELAHWHESVSATDGFRLDQRVQLLLSIDDAAQASVRRVNRDYVAATRPSRAQENRMWIGAHHYWQQAGAAFANCVDRVAQNEKGADSAKSLLPLLLVRALRSLTQQVKWMNLRYGPVDIAVWGTLNRVYAYAEARKLTEDRVQLYPAFPGDSTPRHEFLRATAFNACSPDSLVPVEAEIAERMIGDFVPEFLLANARGPELTFWIDLGQVMAPVRIVKAPAAAPGVRYIGAGPSLVKLHGLIDRIGGTREVPASVNLGGTYDTDQVLSVMKHLAAVWSPQPPERKYQRHAVKSRLVVAPGFAGVLQVLDALGGFGASDVPEVTLEAWVVENVSAGGIGASVPQTKGDWLRVGALLALQPEGGGNWVIGIVRRLNKAAGMQARVGIQTVSKTPIIASLSIPGSNQTEPGVLLGPGDADPSEVWIALRSGVYAPVQNLESARGGRIHVYMPLGVSDRSDDFEIARYREMIRE